MQLILRLFQTAIIGLVSQVALAGTITTPIIGTRQALTIDFGPDPAASGNSAGELTITVSTTAKGVAVADRDLEVVLCIGNFSSTATSYPVRIKLPQGATSATSKLHYTLPHEQGSLVVDVFEDGQSIAGNSSRSVTYSRTNNKRSTWLEIVPDGTRNPPAIVGAKCDTIDLSQASADWRMYSAFDAVLIRHSELKLASTEQIQALLTYVLAGGHCVVISRDKTDDAVLAVDRIFGMVDDEPEVSRARWSDASIFSAKVGAMRSHGGGKLYVLNNEQLGIEDLIKSSMQFSMSSVPLQGNGDVNWHWRNLIQSVGGTPIWGFVSFVTLFVIVVGPIAIWFTSKLRHRTLLMVLVPAVSLITTLLVVVYSLVSEGWGSYGRVASVQFVDELSDQSFVWSRQSYFCGGGEENLSFPAQSILKLVNPNFENHRGSIDPRVNSKVVEIRSEKDTVLLSGWLLPRNQQHLLAGFATKKPKLPVNISRASNGSLAVNNLTDNLIPVIILKESEHQGYFIEQLMPGETREVAPDRLDSIALKRNAIDDFTPQVPNFLASSYFPYLPDVSEDPVDGIVHKLTSNKLSDFGFIIVQQKTPDIPLPLERSAYEKEKHFHIMTGVTRW
jgi:hypothetical protein